MSYPQRSSENHRSSYGNNGGSYSSRENSAGRNGYNDRRDSRDQSRSGPYDRNHRDSRGSSSNGYENDGDRNGYNGGGDRNGYRNSNDSNGFHGYDRNSMDSNGFRGGYRNNDSNGFRGSGRGLFRGTDRGGYRGGSGRPNPGNDVGEIDLKDIQNLQIVNEADLPPSVPSKGDVQIEINGFAMILEKAKNVWQYDLQVEGKGRNKTVDLTRHSDNDAARNLKFDALGELFKMLLKENPTFFHQDVKDLPFFVYDRSHILYSSLDLLPKKDKQTFTLNQEHLLTLKDRTYTRKYSEIYITLQKTTMLVVKDYATGDKSTRSQIHAYVNILTNQAKLTDFYVFDQKMFRKASNIQVDRDQKYVIKEGLQKGARAIATETGGSSEMMLQIDSKKAAFYTGLNLVQYIFECNYNWRQHDIENPANWKKIIGQLQNLAVKTTHLEKNRKFVVAAITKYSAADSMFPLKEGGQMSVAQYFSEKQRPLKYPHFPCIMESKNNRSALFPLELLKVMDGQRVPMNKMPGTLTQFMLRQCQQKPADLIHQIIDEIDILDFNNSTNPWLIQAGIKFKKSHQFVQTQAKELPPPAINYGNKQLQLQSSLWKLDERRHKFLEPAHIQKLAIIARDSHTAKNFGDRIVTMSKQLGMIIDRWSPIELYTENDSKAIENLCNDLMKRSYTFLFFIADSPQLHSAIKFSEIHDKIPTQQMKIDSTKKGADTTKNIIMKFNAKAGGKNHSILSNPAFKNKEGGSESVDFIQSILQTALVIGLEMSHPPKVRIDQYSKVQAHEPTCVGIAGTVDHYANSQSGGYFYQNGGTFLIDGEKLSEKVIDMIKEYYLRNQFYPTYLIIYRSGLSEGQFAEVDVKECQVLRRYIDGFYAQLMIPLPKISVIAVQRKTNYRLFKPAKELEQYIGTKTPAHIQNVTPGTTITQRGTNPEAKEFIMVPQKALLGTAKPIVGTVIFDSPPFSTNIEHMANLSNSLCYMHEICTSAISIPAPLKSAEQLAKRGKNNWVHWQKNGNFDDDNSSVASSTRQLKKDDVENFKLQTAEWFNDLSNDLQVKIKTMFWA
uniref:Uncharacterized protein n=1 Tax=Panagrolaimus sp. ES5 TaxID=591445 RepID=A0AC34GNE7_9BILA